MHNSIFFENAFGPIYVLSVLAVVVFATIQLIDYLSTKGPAFIAIFFGLLVSFFMVIMLLVCVPDMFVEKVNSNLVKSILVFDKKSEKVCVKGGYSYKIEKCFRYSILIDDKVEKSIYINKGVIGQFDELTKSINPKHSYEFYAKKAEQNNEIEIFQKVISQLEKVAQKNGKLKSLHNDLETLGFMRHGKTVLPLRRVNDD